MEERVEVPDLKNGATEPTEETELSVDDRFRVMLALRAPSIAL